MVKHEAKPFGSPFDMSEGMGGFMDSSEFEGANA